jgi:PAS domain-containing protein
VTTVCAWCARVLVAGTPGEAGGPVTHGICSVCLAAVSAERPRPLKEFLDQLAEPVLCVGRNADLVSANVAAERLLGRELSSAVGTLGGDLLCCRWARLPGGCGKTEHCAACTIRRTITAVHATGRPVTHAPAWMDPEGGGGRIGLIVSAEKAGEVVLLRIDRMGETAG